MAPRALACVVLLALMLVPALGLAGDDLSGPRSLASHESGLRHQAPRPWRTIPAVVEPRVVALRMVAFATLDPSEPAYALPFVVRTPFVPPRG